MREMIDPFCPPDCLAASLHCQLPGCTFQESQKQSVAENVADIQVYLLFCLASSSNTRKYSYTHMCKIFCQEETRITADWKSRPEYFSPEVHFVWSSQFLNHVVESQLCKINSKKMAFWHQNQSDTCFFQLLIPRSTTVSLLESELGLKIVTQLTDKPENDRIDIYSLWCRCSSRSANIGKLKTGDYYKD